MGWSKFSDRYREQEGLIRAGPLAADVHQAAVEIANRALSDGRVLRAALHREVYVTGLTLKIEKNGVTRRLKGAALVDHVIDQLLETGMFLRGDSGALFVKRFLEDEYGEPAAVVLARRSDKSEKRRAAGRLGGTAPHVSRGPKPRTGEQRESKERANGEQRESNEQANGEQTVSKTKAPVPGSRIKIPSPPSGKTGEPPETGIVDAVAVRTTAAADGCDDALDAAEARRSSATLRAASVAASEPGEAPPRDVVAAVWRAFRAAYHRRHGVPYLGGSGPDAKAAQAIARLALQAAAHERAVRPGDVDDAEVVIDALAHWCTAYVADEREWFVQQAHPLRALPGEVQRYGYPETWALERARTPAARPSLARGAPRQTLMPPGQPVNDRDNWESPGFVPRRREGLT